MSFMPLTAKAAAGNEPSPRLPPLLSLDFSEWDLFTEDAFVEAKDDEGTPISIRDPALCQLRWFIDQVTVQLRTIDQVRWLSREKVAALAGGKRELHDAVPLLDWSSAAAQALTRESTDGQVVRALQRGHYHVVCALFWVQTSYGCVTQLHLMTDIITSKRWTNAFCYIIKELAGKRGVLSAQEHALLRAKIATMTVDKDDSTPSTPFTVNQTSSSSSHPPPNLVLALVREMLDTPDVSAEQVELTVHRLLPNGYARARVQSILHAQFVLARLVASEHHLRPSKATLQAASESRTWLSRFLVHGCRCVS